MGLDGGNGFRRETVNILSNLAGIFFQKNSRHDDGVFTPVFQGGQRDVDDIEPIKQIFSE